MRHILVAIDLDEHAATAIRVARSIAGPEARIRVVHVDTSPAAAAHAGSSPPATPEGRLRALREHAGTIPGAEHNMLEGPTARAILEEAHAWRADTIVLAPRSKSRLERLLMGSVSTEILKQARCNVLLARPARAIERILVCTDMHEPSQRAARLAAQLAPRRGATLTLLFAADPALWGPRATAPWPPEAYEIDADWLDRAQQEALHEWLRKKLQEFNGKHMSGAAHAVLEDGSPKDVLTRAAGEHDLVVVGTHGPNAYERAFVGSVAEHVAARAPASVLVVKQ